MFTGIVTESGRLARIQASRGVTRLAIDAPRTSPSVRIGDSLAVNGICLTVTRVSGTRLSMDATAETRRLTTLPSWRTGDRVHLEPALRVGDPMGGHLVTGHVDGVGRIVARVRVRDSVRFTVALDPRLAAWLLPKGSIAIDGVSLTLDEGPFDGACTVTIIPHTLDTTHLGMLTPGDRVNLEMDVSAKAAVARTQATRLARPRPLTVDEVLRRGWTR